MSTKELFEALALAQTEVSAVTKDAANPQFKQVNKPGSGGYATLTAYADVARPVLSKHGLSVVTLPACGEPGGDAAFVTTLYHRAGGHIEQAFTIPFGHKRDPQGLGSCMTYARRYCLAAWLNMWAEDDDAETAMGRGDAAPAKANTRSAFVGRDISITPPPKRDAKQLIETLLNAPSVAAIESLKPDMAPHQGTPEWASILAAAKSRKDKLLTEAK